MGFTYPKLTEEEAEKARQFELLPDGIYDFEVVEAKPKMSKAGNSMLEMKIKIRHDGKEHNVFDNLIGTENMTWKTIHFCRTTGLVAQYEADALDERVVLHKRGMCEICSKPERPKNDGSGEVWKAKNEVVDYLTEEMIKQAEEKNAGTGFLAPEGAPPSDTAFADVPM
jgi:hypothetical protein